MKDFHKIMCCSRVYIIKVDQPEEQTELSHLLALLPQDRACHIQSFTREEDRRSALFSSVLSRYAISRETGLHPAEIELAQDSLGKPYVKGLADMHISRSHSGDWVVCAVSPQQVGIDIEKIRSVDPGACKMVLSADEHTLLMSMEEHLQKACFMRLWTAKESYLKALGVGLHQDPSDVIINIHKDSMQVQDPQRLEYTYMHQLNIDPAYQAAVCFLSEDQIVEVEHVTQRDIMAVWKHTDIPAGRL